MSVLLGVDVGGTKAHARVLTSSVQRDVVLPSRTWLTHDQKTLLTAVQELSRAIGAVPDAVCVGASGCESANDADRMRRIIAEVWPGAKTLVVNDAELVCPAAGLDVGVALVSGTGAIAVATDAAGKTWRSGGWGHALGDDGSAYALVRSAAREVLADADWGRPPEILAKVLQQALSVDDAFAMVPRLHADPDPGKWAALAPLICAAASAGDAQSARMVGACINDLAALANVVMTRSGVVGPVILAGGLLRHQTELRQVLGDRLLQARPDLDVRVLRCAPVAGAVAVARRLLTDC